MKALFPSFYTHAARSSPSFPSRLPKLCSVQTRFQNTEVVFFSNPFSYFHLINPQLLVPCKTSQPQLWGRHTAPPGFKKEDFNCS